MKPSLPRDDPGLEHVLGPLIAVGETASEMSASGSSSPRDRDDLLEMSRLLFTARETATAGLRAAVLELSAAHRMAANRISAISGLSQTTISRWIKEDRADPDGVHARLAP